MKFTSTLRLGCVCLFVCLVFRPISPKALHRFWWNLVDLLAICHLFVIGFVISYWALFSLLAPLRSLNHCLNEVIVIMTYCSPLSLATEAYTHTHTLTHINTLAHTIKHTHTRTHTNTPSHYQTRTQHTHITYVMSFTHTHIKTHTQWQTRKQITIIHTSHIQTHKHAHQHTHTHTPTHTRTHVHTNTHK